MTVGLLYGYKWYFLEPAPGGWDVFVGRLKVIDPLEVLFEIRKIDLRMEMKFKNSQNEKSGLDYHQTLYMSIRVQIIKWSVGRKSTWVARIGSGMTSRSLGFTSPKPLLLVLATLTP